MTETLLLDVSDVGRWTYQHLVSHHTSFSIPVCLLQAHITGHLTMAASLTRDPMRTQNSSTDQDHILQGIHVHILCHLNLSLSLWLFNPLTHPLPLATMNALMSVDCHAPTHVCTRAYAFGTTCCNDRTREQLISSQLCSRSLSMRLHIVSIR